MSWREQDGTPIQCCDIHHMLGNIDNHDVALSHTCLPILKKRGT